MNRCSGHFYLSITLLRFRSVLKLSTGLKRAETSCSFHPTFLLKMLLRLIIETSLEMESFYCIFCTGKLLLYLHVKKHSYVMAATGGNTGRHCQTGITRDQYRAAVRTGREVAVWLFACSVVTIPLRIPSWIPGLNCRQM